MSEVNNPVLGYADSYRQMARTAKAEGRNQMVDMFSVVTDLERNIAPLFDAAQVELAIWKTKACEAAEREAALREELAKLKEVTNFKDAVACVFDMLKYTAANTGRKDWDDQLEDLAEDVIEFAPEYKKQWKDIGALSASLTAAEQRNSTLTKALVDTREALGREYWDQYAGLDETRDILDAALQPTESGASE